MKKALLLTMVAIVMTFTSCKKDDISGTIGVQIGPITFSIKLSNGGTGMYYSWGQVPPDINVTACYVKSKPLSQTSIAVFDPGTGNSMGVVNCTFGTWQQSYQLFEFLQNWDYSKGPCVVLVEWDQKFTSGPWTGHIIG